MAAIFQATFSNAFSSTLLRISLKYVPGCNKHCSSIVSDNGLAPVMRQAII